MPETPIARSPAAAHAVKDPVESRLHAADKGQVTMEQRWKAWHDFGHSLARAGLPAPEILHCTKPLSDYGYRRDALTARELEQRYLENALLLQEADWFLRDLDVSLGEVRHVILLLDREGWVLRVHATHEDFARLAHSGIRIGTRAAADSPDVSFMEPALCGGQPVVALFPAVHPLGEPGCTMIMLPIHLPSQGTAGTISVAFYDRRVSCRLYSYTYAGAAAVERQMLWNDRLARADRLSLVGTMISQIVHEVKNPLAAMKAALQLAQASAGADRNECLELVNKEIEELNSLVENLLSLAKPAQAQFALHCLESVLEEVLGLVGYEAALRSIHLEYRQARTPSFLRCDPRLLKQAFLNLIRNAIQAMPQGGILTLAVHRTVRRGGVTVQVADTGVGIPTEHLAHLFEPFFTTKGTSGTGLGLSVTRRIIKEVHQGEIGVESTSGVGTRFTVFLPFNPEVRASENVEA